MSTIIQNITVDPDLDFKNLAILSIQGETVTELSILIKVFNKEDKKVSVRKGDMIKTLYLHEMEAASITGKILDISRYDINDTSSYLLTVDYSKDFESNIVKIKLKDIRDIIVLDGPYTENQSYFYTKEEVDTLLSWASA